MKNKMMFLLLVICVMMTPAVVAQEKQFVMDAQTCIEMTRWLEQNPFHEKAKAVRAVVMKYISDTPDFTVSPCSEFIGDLLGKHKTGNDELIGQYMFAMGAFCCEHPDKKDLEIEKQVAGVQSMLDTYAVMKKADPKIKIKFMEKLIKLKEKGNFEEFVNKQVEKCLK